MRFVGHKLFVKSLPLCLGALLPFAGSFSPVSGQTAPYILPYTMSTYAGPSATLTIGAKCGTYTTLGSIVTTANLIALDNVGDGCQVPGVSIGNDPHDLRVDAKGNIFYIDNTSKDVVHRIDAETGLETIYAGSITQTYCSAGDKFGGDGCVANDGAANSTTTTPHYTAGFAAMRGLGVAPNGDVFIASYSGNITNRIPAAPPAATPTATTGLMLAVAGNGTAGYFDGAVAVSEVDAPRGISADPNTGTVYVADTGNDIIRKSVLSNGTYTVSAVTAPGGVAKSGSAGCIVAPYAKNISNGPASSAVVCAPEDVQVDLYGNVFIADAGNNVIRAIYMGSGTLPGVQGPLVSGNIYLIAGYNSLNTTVTANTYPTDGSTPTFPATTIAFNLRKMALDAIGNIYIADGSFNVIWFVDHATGSIRLLAGDYTGAGVAGGVSRGCTAPYVQLDTFGDGCPGPQSGLYMSGGSNPANSADNQGNLYISDSEGASSAATARIRKLLSGLNFPATTVGTAATPQTVFVHFAPGDGPAATTPFVSSGSDFTVGSPNCPAANSDTTADCYVPITFKPTQTGYDTATLTITSKGGGSATYLLTGTGNAADLAIDPGSTALVNTPSPTKNAQGIAVDGAGNAYIADTGNNRILLYSAASGTTTVFAGTGTAGYTGDNHAATAATLNGPKALTLNTDGNLYIADTGNNVIRKINPATGIITTYAGGGTTLCAQNNNSRGDGCPGLNATFSSPSGIVADNLGQLYVADTGNNVIRQINVLSWVSTFAGGASTVCTTNTDTFGDGCSAASAIFSSPTALAYDAKGKFILVADTGHHVIRKIDLANTFSYAGTGTSTTAGTILINGVALVAGNGQAGSSVDSNSSAILSQLNGPTGVAVDAAENVYIADTQNDAIRFVNSTTGVISTIVGINASAGTGTVPGPASGAQLNLPGGVAVTPNGTVFVADSGNNRILTDNRSQITFVFGRTNLGSSSPLQTFTETNIGTSATSLSSSSSTAFYTPSGTAAAQFTLTSPSSGGCVNGEALAVGASCTLQGQFTPTTTGTFSETYTESALTAPSSAGPPSITLTGVGAVLTPTTSTVAQTVPATGNSQYGGSVTLSATVTATCNTAAPSCYPTGTVRIVVDGTAGSPLTLSNTATASQNITGLAVGQHTISCNYSGDNFYAASTCANVVITVSQASTTSLLSATNNNQPQFTSIAISATVVSNTSGTPTGTVNFFANGTAIGSAPLNSTTGVATLTLGTTYDSNGNILTNTTLLPGTYSLTCTYTGSTNFAPSNCPAFSFTVAPSPVAFSLTAIPCTAAGLDQVGTTIPGKGVACSSGVENFTGTTPVVATGQGSTADVTVFINVTNTVSGTLTFSCSGLPAASACTFSPSSITLAATTSYVSPVYTDVTLWTDLQPGNATNSALHAPTFGPTKTGSVYAAAIGWPIAFLGLTGLLWFRRKHKDLRALALVCLLLVMLGSSLALSGCGAGGPGAYQAVLTPVGTYPVTITVKGAGVSQSVVVNFVVAGPGIPGQE